MILIALPTEMLMYCGFCIIKILKKSYEDIKAPGSMELRHNKHKFPFICEAALIAALFCTRFYESKHLERSQCGHGGILFKLGGDGEKRRLPVLIVKG